MVGTATMVPDESYATPLLGSFWLKKDFNEGDNFILHAWLHSSFVYGTRSYSSFSSSSSSSYSSSLSSAAASSTASTDTLNDDNTFTVGKKDGLSIASSLYRSTTLGVTNDLTRLLGMVIATTGLFTTLVRLPAQTILMDIPSPRSIEGGVQIDGKEIPRMNNNDTHIPVLVTIIETSHTYFVTLIQHWSSRTVQNPPSRPPFSFPSSIAHNVSLPYEVNDKLALYYTKQLLLWSVTLVGPLLFSPLSSPSSLSNLYGWNDRTYAILDRVSSLLAYCIRYNAYDKSTDNISSVVSLTMPSTIRLPTFSFPTDIMIDRIYPHLQKKFSTSSSPQVSFSATASVPTLSSSPPILPPPPSLSSPKSVALSRRTTIRSIVPTNARHNNGTATAENSKKLRSKTLIKANAVPTSTNLSGTTKIQSTSTVPLSSAKAFIDRNKADTRTNPKDSTNVTPAEKFQMYQKYMDGKLCTLMERLNLCLQSVGSRMELDHTVCFLGPSESVNVVSPSLPIIGISSSSSSSSSFRNLPLGPLLSRLRLAYCSLPSHGSSTASSSFSWYSSITYAIDTIDNLSRTTDTIGGNNLLTTLIKAGIVKLPLSGHENMSYSEEKVEATIHYGVYAYPLIIVSIPLSSMDDDVSLQYREGNLYLGVTFRIPTVPLSESFKAATEEEWTVSMNQPNHKHRQELEEIIVSFLGKEFITDEGIRSLVKEQWEGTKTSS